MNDQRVIRKGAVKVRVLANPKGYFCHESALLGRVIDLSESGMKLNLDKSMALGCLLSLKFVVLARQYHLYGRVRWSREAAPHFIGIEIDSRHSPDLIQWTRLFESQNMPLSL